MKALACAMLALLPTAAAQDDDVLQVMAALRLGSAATKTGNLRALRHASEVLTASGAVPLDGVDLAGTWGRRARKPAAAVYRDRLLGPGYRRVTLGGNATWYSEQAFLAGQRAQVGVVPVHAEPFSMQIVGDDHQAVCHASVAHDRCDWVPTYTARFRIELRNDQRQPAQYLIVIQ